jgi:hypothetical protein
VISATANSNKFQKNRFWKENPTEDMVTLGPRVEATLITMKSRKYKKGEITKVIQLTINKIYI